MANQLEFDYKIIPNIRIRKTLFQQWIGVLKRASFIIDSDTICTSKEVKASVIKQLKDLESEMIEALSEEQS